MTNRQKTNYDFTFLSIFSTSGLKFNESCTEISRHLQQCSFFFLCALRISQSFVQIYNLKKNDEKKYIPQAREFNSDLLCVTSAQDTVTCEFKTKCINANVTVLRPSNALESVTTTMHKAPLRACVQEVRLNYLEQVWYQPWINAFTFMQNLVCLSISYNKICSFCIFKQCTGCE
jgi:hypothetical protein